MKRKKTIEYASPKNGKRGASRGRHPIFLPKIVAWPKIRKKRIIDSPAIKDESREKNEALEKGERETCRVDDVQSYQKLYQKLYNPRQKKKDQRFFDDKWNENKEHHVDTQSSRSFYQKLTKLKTKRKESIKDSPTSKEKNGARLRKKEIGNEEGEERVSGDRQQKWVYEWTRQWRRPVWNERESLARGSLPCVCVCVCVFRPSWIIRRHAWRQLELGCCKLETAVCVLIKSNETNLRSIMRPLEWYGNASCRPRSIKLRIATRYPSSTNVTGFQPPPPLSRQAFRIPAILLNDRSKKISNAWHFDSCVKGQSTIVNK